MKLLILGGTRFLGRTVATLAAGRGHDVTCAARGSVSRPPDSCRFVRLDRDLDAAVEVLAGERWDAVVDVARQPGQVRRAVQALEPVSDAYVFVSTASVYPDWTLEAIDESTATVEAAEADTVGVELYGEGKVACENAVLEAFGHDRTTLVRAGLIGGPGDSSGRSGYWPWRFAHPTGPRVLVPDAYEQVGQLVDVRDLAAWLVTVCEERVAGTFLADGPATTLGDALTQAAAAAGASVEVARASEEWLLARDVQPWMGARSLPLWLGDPTMRATFDTSAAVRAGLVCRPLRETFEAALEYELTRSDPWPRGAGLSDGDEAALLADLTSN